MTNVTVKNVGTVAGYNSNFFQGRNDGKEPTSLGYQCDKQGKFSCTRK